VIAVDTNVLVHAHRRDAELHERCSAAVRGLAEGRAAWALPWACVHEFLAIVTHPRIYAPPTPVDAALDQVAAWLESPSVVLLGEGPDHWSRLAALVRSSGVVGPRVHDARVAAVCAAAGVRTLWTFDRDFSRFPELTTTAPPG
jgi:uncharacterized protein